MASQNQFGDWAADLHEARTLTEPLRLECDLHVTRAVFTPGPNNADQSVSVYFKINDGKQFKLCELDKQCPTVEMDNKVFPSGNSIRFSVGKLTAPSCVKLEGYFGFAAADHSLSDQLTGVEHRLALHVTATASELGKQIELVSAYQRDTIIRLEGELRKAAEENERLAGQVAELRHKQQVLEDWIVTLQGNRTRC